MACGDRDQRVGGEQRTGQVAAQVVESLPLDRFGKAEKPQVVHRGDQAPHHRTVALRHEEVGREEHVDAVEEHQDPLDDHPEELQGRSDRQQEPGRQVMKAEAGAERGGERRRRRLVGGGEGVGVEVQLDARVDLGQAGQDVPLVPADAGHLLEEREDVDPDGEHVLAPHLAPPPAAQACRNRPREVAREVGEEGDGDGDAPAHGGASVH